MIEEMGRGKGRKGRGVGEAWRGKRHKHTFEQRKSILMYMPYIAQTWTLALKVYETGTQMC
jgi:hypothetical protein